MDAGSCTSAAFCPSLLSTHLTDKVLFAVLIQREKERHLVGLEAAGHTVLVDAAAAVGQTALTHVLPGARRVHVTASVHQQVLPLTHVT